MSPIAHFSSCVSDEQAPGVRADQEKLLCLPARITTGRHIDFAADMFVSRLVQIQWSLSRESGVLDGHLL
jgi:hypothetical protein